MQSRAGPKFLRGSVAGPFRRFMSPPVRAFTFDSAQRRPKGGPRDCRAQYATAPVTAEPHRSEDRRATVANLKGRRMKRPANPK